MLPLIAFFALLILSTLVNAMCFRPKNAVQLWIEQTIAGLYSHVVRGHDVVTVSGGIHRYDVLAHRIELRNRSTPLGMGAFSNYSSDDFDITRIDNDTETWTQFNGLFTPTLRGCQHGVTFYDQVLWAFNAFAKVPSLKLDDPCVTNTDASIQLITDRSIGSPVAGATVDGQINDASGHFTTFSNAWIERMKTDENDSIRSNALTIAVS